MPPNAVLLLNLDQPGDLYPELRQMLASSASHGLHFEERAESSCEQLLGTILEIRPAVVCLVAAETALAPAARLVKEIREADPARPVMVVTGHAQPGSMFDLLEAGAADFVTPPLRDCEILPRLWRLVKQADWSASADRPSSLHPAIDTLIGQSRIFLDQVDQLPRIACCDASVLISGETGTGKEVFARAIHRLSPRSDGAFVPVNCGAIPLELVENELFGHERGAYTSAMQSGRGLIQEADGGTLFLDEIDSLPLLAQVKLLRFLQEKEYRALGSSRTRRADVRIVTATNIDIEKAVSSGRLRQDLYYRLDIVTVALPPLRKRPDDIPLLANHFLRKFAARSGRHFAGFSIEAQRQMMLHEWRGNVRELEHMVERAVALASGPLLEPADLALGARTAAAPHSFREAKARVVEEFERTYLGGLLVACHGNVSRAAEVAQKDRRAFWELLRKHKIDARAFKAPEALHSPEALN